MDRRDRPLPVPAPNGADADSADGLVSPGHCVVCARHVADSMAVAYVESGSGPGGIVEACLAHARELAAYTGAPQWLKDDLATLDVQRRSIDSGPPAEGGGRVGS